MIWSTLGAPGKSPIRSKAGPLDHFLPIIYNMKRRKFYMVSVKPLIATLVFGFVAVSVVMGQNSNSSREMSVEEYYLQQSIQNMVIREQARGDTEDNRRDALKNIGLAINSGNDGEEIRATLEYLATEGTISISRTNGRITNNYPLVRRESVKYLGELGTPEAKDTLLRILIAEDEPMVLCEAFLSLGKIGLNDNDQVAAAISQKLSHYEKTQPDDLLAITALEAYEQLLDSGGPIKDQRVIQSIQSIANGNYPRTVRERARSLLNDRLFRSGGTTTAAPASR
jgi:hypothetical protein